jgi:hypothetical protein
VDGVSRRLVALRMRAGMTQQAVADAMGRSRTGRKVVGELERRGLESACLLTVAEYLRAVRAGFGELKDVLDRYTSLPIPGPRRKLAEAAPLPRLVTDSRALVLVSAGGEKRELHSRTPSREEELRVLRIRRRAGYWELRKLLEFYLHSALHAAGAPPGSRVRRGMAAYARRVFNALFRTRGAKETMRVERLARLRERARKYYLDRELAEDAEAMARLAYDEMSEHDELDWMPEADRAFAIMSVKPKRRVVTDAEMCLAEWWKVAIPYDSAVMAAYERTHKAALDVADSARCDARALGRYRQAAMRAANIARSTAPDTPQRKRSVADFQSTGWPAEMDRKLLDRILTAALAVWDAGLPTLPPAPGPRPV